MNHPQIAISKLLIRKNKTIAAAESCTGGLLANLFTNIPGASQYFLLGIVAYNNRMKTSLLKIPSALIKRHGAVSYQVARLMARNVKKIAAADYGIGITGIAGPLGGTPQKPTGTVFISVASKDKIIAKKFRFPGNRLTVKRKTSQKALSLLKEIILNSN
ncbi:MAG: CinA family protein [Candidatus Omnitrophota bacterium]